jgi:hypothetical protein
VVRFQRRSWRLGPWQVRWRLIWSRRAGSMLPWVTAVVLLVSPIMLADFDYRYLLPVLPFAGLAAGLAFAPARAPGSGKMDKWQRRSRTGTDEDPVLSAESSSSRV